MIRRPGFRPGMSRKKIGSVLLVYRFRAWIEFVETSRRDAVATHEDTDAERRTGRQSHSRVERERREDGEDDGGGGETIRRRETAELYQLDTDGGEHAAQDQERGSVQGRREADDGSVAAKDARLP